MIRSVAGRAATAAMVVAAVTLSGQQAKAAGACTSPTQMEGFKTCADLAKAEQEGAFVLYTTDPEAGTAKLLAAFNQDFPKIKTSFIRLQAGALYAKLMAERQAKSYLVDAMQISDLGFVLDLEKRKGYMQYISPEMAAYKPEYKSNPEGYWTWGTIIMAGIAYNPKTVPADQAPKSWKDALDPKWAGDISVKVSNSGLQHETWYELRRIYGDEYFKKLGELKPRAFDSYVQQYDRMVNGQDKIIHTAQYSGYLEFKAKGAPVEFVYPADGLPAGPETWGLIAEAPHPNAAQLFLDWFLSVRGQKAIGDALFLNSARADVAPPPGGVSVDKLKLLFPSDWADFITTRPAFAKEWDRMVGLK
jgi:iron(III) transport system substrate-binding protein